MRRTIGGVNIHDNYVQISNNHIFIGVSQADMSMLDIINETYNQHIHIFIASLNNIEWDYDNRKAYSERFGDNMIEWIISNITCSKVVFHIPYQAKDMKTLVEYYASKTWDTRRGGDKWITNDHGYIKCITERKGPVFIRTKGARPTSPFRIRYEDYEIHASIDVIESREYHKNIACLNDLEYNGPFKSELHRKYPELFKDTIIKNFKKTTHPVTLQAFKDDNDIWDYINHEGEWKGDK